MGWSTITGLSPWVFTLSALGIWHLTSQTTVSEVECTTWEALDDRSLLRGAFFGGGFAHGALFGGALFTGLFFGEGLSWGWRAGLVLDVP